MVARLFDSESERELVRLHEAGWTQTRLAEKYGTNIGTIRRSLQRAGVRTRGQGWIRRTFSEEERADIEVRYRSGRSQDQIARELGTSQAKISTVLRSRGVVSGRGGKLGMKHPLWKGGRIITSAGYVGVRPQTEEDWKMVNTSGYALEHRLVMARHLGRPLDRHETVHHVNGDRTDNRLENLEFRNGPHGRGATKHCPTCTCGN